MVLCILFDSFCSQIMFVLQAKPDEEIKFNFTISNESRSKNVNINFIQIPQNNLNFSMNDHSLGFGCAPVCLKPSKYFD